MCSRSKLSMDYTDCNMADNSAETRISPFTNRSESRVLYSVPHPPEIPCSNSAVYESSFSNNSSPALAHNSAEARSSFTNRSESRLLYSVPHPPVIPCSTCVVDKSSFSNKISPALPSIPPSVANIDELRCKPFYQCPYARTREHFRDIPGPITLHRIFTLLWIVGSGAALFFLQHFLYPGSWDGILRPDLSIYPFWSYFGCVWLISLPAALASFAGNLIFRYNTRLDDVSRTEHNVAFRIVSRGLNDKCLLSTIRSVQREMRSNSLFSYLIEVVTDAGVFIAPNEPDIIHIVVPMDYVTRNGTLYKARALHYACRHSPLPSDTWIVHLDEETQPTTSGIKGIAKMIAEAEASSDVRVIGQGAMTYHRMWSKHPFLTLADMRRSGEDFGQFHLQHRLGIILFGLHGSFIVCRQDMEAELGFDLGVKGSITEDAWWGLLAMEKGYRTKWIDGYLDEQSCQSVMDFLKQRRRWYVGLWEVSWHCPARLVYRLSVIYNTLVWIIVPIMVPFIMVYMTILSYYRVPVPLFLRISTNFVISVTSLVYLNGLVANMREHGTKWWQGVFWMVVMWFALPLCYLIEIMSVVLVLFAPFSANAKGFHVVAKDDVEETDKEQASEELERGSIGSSTAKSSYSAV